MIIGWQTNQLTQQKGIGLVEVLVALLLFSSAALGYAALQARALSSMDESKMRQQALMLLNESVERMRSNNLLLDNGFYPSLFNSAQPPIITNCVQNGGCDATQMANNDVANLRQQAKALGFTLAMVDCPQSSAQAPSHCLIAAWSDTIPGYENLATGSHGSASTHTSTLEAYQPTVTADNQQLVQSKACLKLDDSYVNQANCVFIASY